MSKQVDEIKRLYNALFSQQNEDGVIVERIACARLKAYKYLKGVNGANGMEKIEIPFMPMSPSASLPLYSGTYKNVMVSFYFDGDYFIVLENVVLNAPVSLKDLFSAAVQDGKLYRDDELNLPTSTKEDPNHKTDDNSVEISTGEKIKVAVLDNNYHIVGADGRPIDPKSKEGKEAIAKFLKAKIGE